jgi:hypothetical protein
MNGANIGDTGNVLQRVVADVLTSTTRPCPTIYSTTAAVAPGLS